MSKHYMKTILCTLGVLCAATILADNQTPTVSPIYSGTDLPFSVSLKLSDFKLPEGFHSGAFGEHKGDWLFIAGRVNGMHGFDDSTSNFPPSQQNTTIFVINFEDKEVYSRSLYDINAALTQTEVDSLSVTSPQFYQSKETLYMTGGYGVITSTGDFSTKDALTAIDLPGLIHWVKHPHHADTAKQYIRQIFDPTFQVTGGTMGQVGHEPTLLIFGQNFEGFYFDGGNGDYTNEIRRFKILDDGENLNALILHPKAPDENYRRRDGNIVPGIRRNCDNHLEQIFVALSGVFTVTGGAWTVPVVIEADGESSMANPSLSTTFKQGMNNYVSAFLGLYSKKHEKMFTTVFGGISYGYFDNGTFETDSELPFINQITTISMDKHSHFKQYLMDETFPVILSTGTNPGNELLFGAAADFIPAGCNEAYNNGVLDFDALDRGHNFVGYIIGGIQSTLPNTETISDSSASPYVFKVFVHKH